MYLFGGQEYGLVDGFEDQRSRKLAIIERQWMQSGQKHRGVDVKIIHPLENMTSIEQSAIFFHPLPRKFGHKLPQRQRATTILQRAARAKERLETTPR